jgi:hypothetical protein
MLALQLHKKNSGATCGKSDMKITGIPAVRFLAISAVCWASFVQTLPAELAQSGFPVPDQFRHAEPFIRTLEAGGLAVQDVAQSTLEASFGGEKAAYITTDKGVVEVVVLPGPMDAEQLTITYTKWNGRRRASDTNGPVLAHWHHTGPGGEFVRR